MRRTCSAAWIFAVVSAALALAACGSGSSGAGADATGVGADGDTEASAEADGPACVDLEERCDPDRPNVSQVCAGTAWVDLADCGTLHLTCIKGKCTTPEDGDGEGETDGEVFAGPVVTSSSPQNGEQGIPVDLSVILINFSEPVWLTPGYATKAHVKVRACGLDLTYTALWSDEAGTVTKWGQEQKLYRQLRIEPYGALIPGVDYMTTIDAGGLMDVDDNEFGGHLFQFHTAGAPDDTCEPPVEDTTPPDVDYTIPADGSTARPSQDYVLFVFTEPLLTFRFNFNRDLTWTGSDGATVDFLAQWNEQATQLEINRIGGDLTIGVTYTVTLADNLTDLAQNPLGPRTLTFSVAEAEIEGDVDEEEEAAPEEPESDVDHEYEGPIPDTGVLDAGVDYSYCLSPAPTRSLQALYAGGVVVVRHIGGTFPGCLNKPYYVDFVQNHTALSFNENTTLQSCNPADPCSKEMIYYVSNLFPARYDLTLSTDSGPPVQAQVTIPGRATSVSDYDECVGDAPQRRLTATPLAGGFRTVHEGAQYDMNVRKLFVALEVAGSTVTLDERAVVWEPAGSTCPGRVTTTVSGLASGDYELVYKSEGVEYQRTPVTAP